jgi:hypothetical protein
VARFATISVTALALVAATASEGQAREKISRCRIESGGSLVVNGKCLFDGYPDGSFHLGNVDQNKSFFDEILLLNVVIVGRGVAEVRGLTPLASTRSGVRRADLRATGHAGTGPISGSAPIEPALRGLCLGVNDFGKSGSPSLGRETGIGAPVECVRRIALFALAPPGPIPSASALISNPSPLGRRTASSRLPPVARADLEGRLRVDLSRSLFFSGTAAPAAAK